MCWAPGRGQRAEGRGSSDDVEGERAVVASHWRGKNSLAMGNVTAGGRWKCDYKLGEGSFGAVYHARDIRTREEVAMKLEPTNAPLRNNKYEYELYEHFEGVPGIPLVYYYGRAGNFLTGKWNVLVMELLGPNLGNLMKSCGGRFSLKTTLMIADQTLLLLEHIHDKGFINRDIKLDNLMMGAGRNMHTVYLIDFGLALKIMRSSGHIPYRENVSLIGTAMYMSLNAHRGVEQSRRDDMESLGYVFLHMLNGRLPWDGFNAEANRNKYDKLLRQKESMPLEKLCAGVPKEFLEYFQHVRNLGFSDRPDYTMLRRGFQKRMKKEGLEDDGRYDWSKHTAPRPRSAQYKRGKDKKDRDRDRDRGDRDRGHSKSR